MIGFASIEAREVAARDRMIADGAIPTPTAERRGELARLGIEFGGELGAQILVRLPAGWRAEADMLNHRRWFMVDERGQRRVACFWKDAGYGTPNGSVAVLPEDRLVRTWEGEGSLLWHRDGMVRLTVSCACGSPEKAEARFSRAVFGGNRGFVEQHVARVEQAFRGVHPCGRPG